MKALKIYITLYCIMFCTILHSQNIEEINNKLDNVYYLYLTDLDYMENIKLPDSTKNKVVNILNGYLPKEIINKATYLDKSILDNLNKKMWSICNNDSLCFIQKQDSIKNEYINNQIAKFKSYPFPKELILSIGSWNVQEASIILLNNINNPLYPRKETLLALAKLGNDSILENIEQLYTLDYIIEHTILKTDSPKFIYRNISVNEQVNNLISDFYLVGIYLQDKDILSNMVDFIDITGKETHVINIFGGQSSITEELYPIEQSTLLWLSGCFIANSKWKEWCNIIDNYSEQISNCKNDDELIKKISQINKNKIKEQLKYWIEQNVHFE
ncbi:hypothetical protein [Dysgonomonas sp. 520]|uniref:hypothetical protein n=1 Tax=Dysgonomonas sp. 520 TaxID=2302931 RepID=UPI0013D89A2E|nr:hypothetical protein [Dysgonomonas sp. 520]NDW11239.1 hypothetical protein [Dysgonomonas sp. 520]